MRALRIPGLVVAVFDDYQVVWSKAYGLADADTKEPLTTSTLMQAGSISKSVAALVALQEVTRGKLSLDANINLALKSWKLPDSDFMRDGPVTLRRLLSHTAGTTVHGFPGYADGDPIPTVPQLLDGKPPANTAPVRVAFTPGSQFSYSGGGITIVQQALIDVEGGRPYPSIAQDLVTGPLGMTNSTYEEPLPPERARFAASGHHDDKTIPGKRHVYPEMAAAGLWTTPNDLAHFLIEIQRALAGRGAHVPQEVATWMTTGIAPARGGEVGLGFFLSKKNGVEYFGHNGDDEGFNAMSVARKRKGYGAVLMANSDEGYRIFPEVRRAIAREYSWDQYDAARFERMTIDASALAALEGRWNLGDDDGFLLTVREGHLELRRPMEAPEELVPVASDVFIARDSGDRLTFTRSEGRDEILLTPDEDEPRRASRLAKGVMLPVFLLDMGHSSEAVAIYRKRLRANAKDPAITIDRFRGFALGLLAEHRDAEGVRVLEVAIALYPDAPNVHEMLADACAENGQLPRARREYATALRLMSRDKKSTDDEKAISRTRMAKKILRTGGAAP